MTKDSSNCFIKQQMQGISHRLGPLKNMLLICFVVASANLFSQKNEEQILNINLGLYVCENELSKEIPADEMYGFNCEYSASNSGKNYIYITSAVLNQEGYFKEPKQECIKRISTIRDIYNAIAGTPVSRSGRNAVTEENWLWGESSYLQGFFDHTLPFSSSAWNNQVRDLKNKLVFRVNVIDKGMFDESEETKSVTMCVWQHGQGINNPYIQ